ncbi:MAG: imidazole glycerol phosphate synthase subunit HisH [Pseudomonadales bacterium]|uniref:imidazole glycerol phosphate synthase subunit HisH n=1 Tax=unclassified Ketobacter TaxID=2639109 RepID=UPI000C8F9FA2|nr:MULTISPECIES: imidazole glycerol phosphate synthase subunit HisH [unclassified Ketobacter]MAQ24182.1 imidazole glycerol phosphate synthase subunit HisH [Pseudomonadales bacterium]RLT87602.1 MAG: imidazole glycerol phosphate synthase subunit HisH [Ketobacter sp. GenoA1]RLT92931.1 MAG: imidazole glycerol phosphate synthase subunit HisH [Ketobacter sp.]|tara:strand:- start:1159 stop:1767 length:609 start_codon:yes stop_codon:yes gene_type:complete
MKIGVITTGRNNLNAVINILTELGVESHIVDEPSKFEQIDALILPGVGSFDAAIQYMKRQDVYHHVESWVTNDKPTLAICLGFQLLFEGSEEGELNGLGVIPGKCKKFGSSLKVPRIGWSFIDWSDHSPFGMTDTSERFYLVHSYHAPRNNFEIALSHYGEDYCVAVKKGNVIGTQFHPEKSLKFGMDIFKKFIGIVNDGKA